MGSRLRCTPARVSGVDESPEMLEAFARRADAIGVAHAETCGRWPGVSGEVEPADVVVCHHVLYNVADLEPFLAALAARARRRVVIEISERHPWSWMSPFWRELHAVARPDRPTAAGAAWPGRAGRNRPWGSLTCVEEVPAPVA
ncbi:MAG: hypothetical protein HY775_00455 [Acidobacteria bacterium]|nr:hypothetical protein [Acidobacteriota bacterium]